jgi:uncharacterized protein with GYD domain
MATFALLVGYTSDGMRHAVVDGFANRKAVLEGVVSALGGGVSGYHLVADGDWDLLITGELPDDMSNADVARMMAAFKAGGAVRELRLLRLTSAEEFDAAPRTAEETYRPPSPA